MHLPARVGIAAAGTGWLTRNVITWHKPNAMPHRTRGRLQHRTEAVLVAGRVAAGPDRPRRAARDRRRVDDPTVQSPTNHPAAIPPQVARRAILAGSRPEQTVLDPLCGSGTTGVVWRWSWAAGSSGSS